MQREKGRAEQNFERQTCSITIGRKEWNCCHI